MNEEILKGIPPDRVNLAKFVIFAATEGGNLYDYITDAKHGFQFKEQLIDVINDIVMIFINNGSVDLYSGEHTRLNFIKPIYKTYVSNMNNTIDVARSFFKYAYSGYSGYSGDNASIGELINKWRIQYPHLDVKLIPKACRAYVDNCKTEGQHMKKMSNFILVEKLGVLESDLASWMEKINNLDDTPKTSRRERIL